jgi:UPF0755 protein
VLLKKILVAAALALFVSGFGLSIWLWQSYDSALQNPVSNNPITIEIAKGDSFKQITDKLITANLDINPFWFKVLALQNGSMTKIKTGEYSLEAGLTMPGILALFVLGKTKQYSITFAEGLSFKQMREKLAADPNVEHTLDAVDAETLMTSLNADVKHPEGAFFPDTYFFEKHTTDAALLKRAYSKMQAIIQQEWSVKADNLPIKTPYEALILASIVEKETAAKAERPQIAGVFTRRLQHNMLLQTDPTVIYGMGDSYKGNITSTDLQTATPYNTYKIRGLPPTPIAMPGHDAIKAVLHPAPGDTLYFVARGDGTHVFSSTLKEHNAAVDRYQRNLK